MFYLKQFFQIYTRQGFKGILFLLLTFTLSWTAVGKKEVDQWIQKLSLSAYLNPYMTVFFDPGSYNAHIEKRVKNLSYVKNVQKVSVEEGMKSWWSLIQDLKLSADWGVKPLSGIRVIFSDHVKAEQVQELGDLIELKMGPEHVTMSGLKFPAAEQFLRFHPFFKMISRFKAWSLIIPLSFLWAILFILTHKMFTQEAYLFERYQRKKMVRSKIWGLGFCVSLISAIALHVVMEGRVDGFGLVIVLAIFMTVWSFSFKEIQWRW
jgi:hypothetical protein